MSDWRWREVAAAGTLPAWEGSAVNGRGGCGVLDVGDCTVALLD